MLSYRVTLDIPSQLVMFVSGLLARRRHEIGTRRGTRALTCSRQAVFALAWFRDRPDVRRLGQGFGISQATAYRYLGEAIEVLAAKAPSLRAGAGVHVPVKQPAGGRCLDINTQTRTRCCAPCATKANAASR